MALIYRSEKGSALTIAELDGNFQYFTGSHSITGSLVVSQDITASNFVGNFVGPIAGTASFALSASHASTSSYIRGVNVDGAVTLAQTASYVLNAVSASFAQTASYVLNAVSASFAQTASYVKNAQTASYVENAQTASYVLNAVSASFANNALTANTASYTLNALSASYATSALQAISASFATTSSYAQNFNPSATASYALQALSASFALSASRAITASFATTAQTATTASFARVFPFTGSAIISGGLEVYGTSLINGTNVGLKNNTSTVLGNAALLSLTTGDGNTGVGFQAGITLQGGGGNTIIGDSALFLASSANNNTAIGFYSLYNITTGTGNIGIGVNNGFNNNTGNYNIYLGNEVYGVSNESNKLRIHNSVSNVTNPLILGDFSTRDLTINGDLTVSGSQVLTLQPVHPLPSSGIATGSFAVSASTPPRPYMWDGSSWYAL